MNGFEQTAGLVGVSPGTVKNDRKANRVAVNGNGHNGKG